MQASPTPDELARRRRKLTLLVGPLVLTFAATSIGVAFAPALLERAPVALILLAPLIRHLVLASPALDAPTFYVVGLVGFFLVDPFAYLLGREYGSGAVEWVIRRAGAAAGWIRWVERMFRRAAPLVLLVSPGPFVNLLAGASGMRVPAWLCLNLGGTLGLLVLVRLFGEALAGPIGVVRAFVEANVLALTVGSVVLVAGGTLLRRRRMRRLLRETQRADSVVDSAP
jgi:membrane protein DedA with SNARE-associated domain